MDIEAIFGLQFLLSLVAYAIIAIKLNGWFDQLDWYDAMFLLLAPHAFRHLGLVFLVPGVVAPTIPGDFSVEAAYGDLATAAVAILTLIALGRRWAVAIPLAWAVNLVGAFDLANALRQIEAVPHFNAAWYVPTFVVPLLLVTHTMMLIRLIDARRSKKDSLAHGQ